MKLYPLLMKPFFRSGQDTPWGGDMLRDALLKDAPGTTGESLEVSAEPGRESTVANGDLAGKALTEAVSLWGESLTGAPGEAFPLRLALLDAAENSPSRSGGSEAWVILNAEPGAEISCGENLILPRPGDVYYIPQGAERSLGASVLAYSLQGSPVGNNPGTCARRPEGATVLCRGGSRTYYICDSAIELSRLNVSGSMPLPAGRMLLLTPIAPCSLLWEDDAMEVAPFSTVIVPAGLDGVRVEGTLKVFAAAVPDQETLRQELGYRAELVPGLTEA